MKAQAILSLLLAILGAISAHSLTKRSLLPGSGRGHHGHHHHQPQRHRQAQGRRQGGRARARAGARRAGRDGDHHHHEEARAIATGYLPAAADDYEYDDLAGYSSDSASTRGQNSALPGYSAEPQPGYEADSRDVAQSQYGEEDITTTESPDTRDLEEEASGDSAGESYGGPDSADDQYGAPSNVDLTRAAPDDNYGAPGAEESGVSLARASDTDYAAPGEYEAPSYEAGNGFPFEAVESRSGPGGQPGESQCPGGSIEQCVGVCPGSSVRVYGACVGGCADRCPENN